jgi:isopentenyldiphosphate isomerase
MFLRGIVALRTSTNKALMSSVASTVVPYEADTELFEVVDETMRVVGQQPRLHVHKTGLLHHSVHVFVFDETEDALLVQQRCQTKRICPNLWDLSCAEHLQPGETQLQGAVRGLKEEVCVDHCGSQSKV